MQQIWRENELTRIEDAIPKATSKERKESLEIQLATAQMMLKQALLQKADLDNVNMVPASDIATNEESHNRDKAIVMELDIDDTSNKEGSDTEMAQTTFNWADVSDDDTVVLQNHRNDNDEWQTVNNKKQKNKKTDNQNIQTKPASNTTHTGGNIHQSHKNPYVKQSGVTIPTVSREQGYITQKEAEVKDNSSLISYLETVKNKTRNPNLNSIRVTTSFTPRTSGAGDYKRVAKELLTYASEIDPSVLLLPWEDSFGGGPISLNDLGNPHTMLDVIKHYFDKPPYVNWQPGTPVYGIGIRFSTDLAKHEFMDMWNIKKREFIQQNKTAYTINLAPMQKSSKAYVIGIAVGSTEDQDYEILNDKLAKEIGIPGIETSFQNINQIGITQDFWKIANTKAKLANPDKLSREHLRTKYLWARPNALAIYVPHKEQVNIARKTMIKKYGSLVNGNDPVWPDGSSMRFLPIKGATIRNAKTKEIVRKRMAFHIWLKANEITMETNMVNIHKQIDIFDGRTFAEVILDKQDNSGTRIFLHFNRVWSNNPTQQRWSLLVKPNLVSCARNVLNDIMDDMVEQYGQEVKQFFKDNTVSSQWLDAVTRGDKTQDDEEDWFDDDDDIEEMVKKGLVDSTFLNFLAGNVDDSDKQSVASWGTGETTYTEICSTQITSSTTTSSITQDNSSGKSKEVEKCKILVKEKLLENGVPVSKVDHIMANKSPYELVFSGIHLPSWEVDKEYFLIMALRAQSSTITDNDEDDDLYD